MKILVLHSELGVLRGGGENVTRNLFAAFAKRGHEITAVFVANRDGHYRILLPSGIKPIPLPGWWSRKLGQGSLSAIGQCIPSRLRLKARWDRVQEALCSRAIRWHDRRFTKRVEHDFGERWKDFDVVYVHGNVTLARKVAQHRPTVLFLPGPVTAECEPALRVVHAVCAHDDALARIQQFLGDHAVELPLGLDCEIFAPGPSSVRSALGWTDKDLVVGYVGRLTHIKGIDLLAAAFRQISEEMADVRLVIVGAGEEERKVRSMLARHFVRRRVHIEPDMPHQRLADWYRAMDLLVMPSRYETMSNAILEASGCGIPFLASDVGGNRMIAADGGGWLFKAECAASLATSLQDILHNREEMKSRAALGAQSVRRRHTWAVSAHRLEEILTLRLGVKV